MRTERSLPRVGVLGILLVALAAVAIFGASRANAGPLPAAADIDVVIAAGPHVFPSDNEIGQIVVSVSNIGTKNAKNVKVNLYEASMWPASVEAVFVTNNTTGSAVNCTHLSNINERCVIDRLPAGRGVTFIVQLRTMNLGAADIAGGVLKASASTAVGEVNTANNKDKTDYFVVE